MMGDRASPEVQRERIRREIARLRRRIDGRLRAGAAWPLAALGTGPWRHVLKRSAVVGAVTLAWLAFRRHLADKIWDSLAPALRRKWEEQAEQDSPPPPGPEPS